MSNPPNELAAYRSYSYYHVLVMCDSTATADALANSTNEDVWHHATAETAYVDTAPGTESLGRYSPKAMKVGNSVVGRYTVLINGSTDAAYVITRAQWTTATAAGAVPGDMSTSLAVEGSIQISEPKGIAFLDQVVKCSIAMGVDSSQAVYVLKTFFVGHSDEIDGGANARISDIPPINFICYDVTGSFDQTGGTYDMAFVAAGHGAARLPQYAKAVNSMSIKAGDTLQQTLTRLQDNINTGYDKYFQCVVDQFKSITNPDPTPIIDSLRKVRYIIEVGNEYQDGNGTARYTVTDQPEQFKSGAGCDAPAQITFPSSTSIEGAIRQIMSMSNQVQRDAVTGDSSGIKYEYKIHTGLRSGPKGGTDGSMLEYTVFYRVERFMSPKTIGYDRDFATLQQDDEDLKKDPNYDKIKRNIIEFDYMYTGKNIDILEFDMKVNMGLAYLQTATLANTFKTQLERVPNRQMSMSQSDATNFGTRFGSKAVMQTPVFFGTQLKSPGSFNAQDAATSIQSAYTMAKHASLEVAEAKMRIVGNTAILRTTNSTTSPESIQRTLNEDGTNEASTPTDFANFHDWSRIPAFAKVRIKMPRDNDDFALFTGSVNSGTDISQTGFADYARDFWFDGYYYVCGIEHVFDNGEFSQTLDMIGLPKKSSFQSTQGGAASKELNIGSGATSCFDSSVGCAGGAGTAATEKPKPLASAAAVAPTTDVAVTNRNDSATILGEKYALTDVIGWNSADPEVQKAITQAAQKVGVDPVLMAMFAAKESNFKPRATAAPRNGGSGGSSATGLFQFITSTWNGLVKAGKATTVVTNQNKMPEPNDPRFDPYNNSIAGAHFIRDNSVAINSKDPGDLYLAHFLGPYAADKIIKADRASSGSQLLSQALGADASAKIAKANPTIVTQNTTVGWLRTWAAKAMATRLRNGKELNTTPSRQTPATVVTTAATGNNPSAYVGTRTAATAVAAQNDCNAQTKASANNASACGPRATASTDTPTSTDPAATPAPPIV